MKKQEIADQVNEQIHKDYVDSLIERVGSDTSGRWISREAVYDLVRLVFEDWARTDDPEETELEEQFENMFKIGN